MLEVEELTSESIEKVKKMFAKNRKVYFFVDLDDEAPKVARSLFELYEFLAVSKYVEFVEEDAVYLYMFGE